MALEILNAKVVEANGLLSKINIGGTTYELKDLIARENIEDLSALIDALSAKVGNVAEGQNLADIIKNIQENAYDDTELQNAIKALQEADLLKADKAQVALDIEAAVKAEAEIARAAEKANAEAIAAVDAALKLAVDNNEEGIDSIKELANWVNTHGAAAEDMTKAIEANEAAIAAMDKAYKEADVAIDGRLDLIEAALGEGEGSVADQIEEAKQAAITAANGYTDGEIDKVEAEVAKKEDKANLKALAYKAEATGTVGGQTIAGVKATGTSTGSIEVSLAPGSEDITSTGSYTPVGTVDGGKVVAAGTVDVQFTNADADAVVSTADYQPEGTVSVALSNNTVKEVASIDVNASHVDPEFEFGKLTTEDVNIGAHNSMTASVSDETLVFSQEMLEAVSFKAVKTWAEGSKKSAGSISVTATPVTSDKTVGVGSAIFTGTVAEDLKVTGVTYKKHDTASATFTGSEVAVSGASFSGNAATISVTGQGKTYAIDEAKFNGAAIELNVGDIVVTDKVVTVK